MISLEVLPRSTGYRSEPESFGITQSLVFDIRMDSAVVIETTGDWHGKFVLTDDRSMIDWGAFGAPRRVDCDDLYRQPQTALQHRRISLCVRPAVREEEVAMVR